MNYFSSRAIQAASAGEPFVIQNNWATGAITKRYRFREHHLWLLDSPSYLGQQGKDKYLVYDNVQWPLPGSVREKAAIESAMALGAMLGRTVILPLFCQFYESPELPALPVLDRWCTMDELFDVDHFTKSFGDDSFRPNSFLSDPRVHLNSIIAAEETTSSATSSGLNRETTPKLCIDVRAADCPAASTSTGPRVAVCRPAGREGATEGEIRGWFDRDPALGKATLLRFGNLAGAVAGFDDPAMQRKFREQIAQGLYCIVFLAHYFVFCTLLHVSPTHSLCHT